MTEVVERLAQGLWRLALRTPTLPPATATNTLVVAGTRVAVIEPASPHADEHAKLDAQLEALRSQGLEIAYIVITHHHFDHVGDVVRLRERYGAQVCAHKHTASRVPFSVDRMIDEGDTLDLGGGRELNFVFTPGHAPGHLVVEVPDAGIAHVGDLVASEGTILIDPRDSGDMREYLASLRKMVDRVLAFDAQGSGGGSGGGGGGGRSDGRSDGEAATMRWVPAHGDVIDDPAGHARGYIAHRLGREAKLLASFEGDDLAIDFDALLERTYDDKPRSILPLARGSLEAHLQKLIVEGRVRREGDTLVRQAPSEATP